MRAPRLILALALLLGQACDNGGTTAGSGGSDTGPSDVGSGADVSDTGGIHAPDGTDTGSGDAVASDSGKSDAGDATLTDGTDTGPTCTSSCETAGALSCDEDNNVLTCAELSDGCLAWGDPSPCGDLACTDGHCAVTCADGCDVAGSRQCDGNAVVTCKDYDGDGCLEWGGALDCVGDTVCQGGFCSVDCAGTNECTVQGAKKCEGNAVEVCADLDFDGCLAWSELAECPTGQTCSGGSCSSDCADECTVVGARQCDGTTVVEECGDFDGDGCLEWGNPVECNDGDVCSSGFCATDCQSECSVIGASKCNGTSVQTCGDSNGDGCLEWGTGVPCGAGLSCANGYCVIGCKDECTVNGAKSCENNGFKTCGDANGDGCLEWGTVVACLEGHTCSSGVCSTTCTDECSVSGAKKCLGDAVQLCGNTDADACLEWGTPAPCGAGEVCSNGHCSSDCEDECTTMGAKACEGTAVKVCDDADSDGCLEWGSLVPCEAGQGCSLGSCSSGCTDECSVSGARKCSGDAVQTCDEVDGDPCLEWGTAEACSAGLTCSEGFCTTTCADACTVKGAKACEGAAVKVCDDSNGDGCLEWGTPVACAQGQTCSSGSCASGCTDECTTSGAKACDGNGVKVCGNTDADSCLEWGTSVPCGPGLQCSNGSCAVSCSNECTVQGARQCAGNTGWQLCFDHDEDGCLEWGTTSACADGEVCSAGNCALSCSNECAIVGAKQCTPIGASVQLCDDYDDDGCLEWGTAVACDGGQVCSGGNCTTTCSDDCDAAGLTQCDPAGFGEQTCGDFDGDGCLSWGSVAPCGPSELCTGGSCQATAAPGAVVINEVLYDAVGSDTTAFVELLGEPGLELDGFVLVGVNGANGQDYNAIALTGSIGDDGLFVVAKTGSVQSVLDEADQLSTLADFQNGPDSIALRWGGAVVDAVGYGDFSGATFAGEGNPAPDVPEGQTLGRDPVGTDTNDNLADFHGYQESTPGGANGGGNKLPVAALSCPATGKTGASLQVDASGSNDPDGSIASYAFAWGDGFQATGPTATATHTYATVGTKVVTVTVTDSLGATASAACSIAVQDGNAPTVIITKPIADMQVTQGTQILGITADPTAVPGRSIVSAQLVIDGTPVGVPDANAPYVFDYTVPGVAVTDSTILLAVQATDSEGSIGLSAARKLFVKNDKPVASFSAVISGNLVVSVDATGSSDTETTGANLVVRWDFENDGVWDTAWSTAKTAVHDYATDGAHVIAMEVKDEVGQVTETTRSVNFQSVQDVSGTVNTTLWYGTINITGDTVVPAGQTLTIAKGTTVVFLEFDQNADGVGDFDLTINGTLVVEGTADEPVVFTTFDTNGQQNASSWNKIVIGTGSTGSTITHAIFEYADAVLDVRAKLTLTDVQMRNNRVGVSVQAGGDVTATNLTVTDSTKDGVQVKGGKITANSLISKNNAWRGLWFESGGASQITTCTVTANGTHGFDIQGTSVGIDDCTITYNGETGVQYRGGASGLLTHSTLRYNEEEGVRAFTDGTGNPTPTVSWNNIFENGAAGSMVVSNASLSATSPYGLGDSSSPSWSAPGGGTILAVEASYSEESSSSQLTGYIYDKTHGNATLKSFASNTSKTFFDVSDADAKAIAIQVKDSQNYAGATVSAFRVASVDPSQTRQLTTMLTSGTLNARHNYLGVWPGVLSAVTYQTASTLDLQGFVGVPFDTSWDPGPYQGGIVVSADTTWSSDVFVTGGVTISGATLTIDAGVTVTFVPTDQDADQIGDWFIDRAAGALVVDGAVVEPVVFDVLGDVPANGGYKYVAGTSSGSTSMKNAVLLDGRECLRVSGGQVDLVDVSTSGCASNGLHALSGGAVTANGLTIEESGGSGVLLEATGMRTFDRLTVDSSGAWGVELLGASAAANAIANATITNNAVGGVRVKQSVLSLSHSNVKFNGWGVLIQGSASGTVASSNIQSNAREGVLSAITGGQQPTMKVNGNNIFGNSTAQTTTLGAVNGAVTSPYGLGDSSTATWTAPNGGKVLFFEATYSEESSSSSLTGYVMSGALDTLVTFASNTSATWYELDPGVHAALKYKVADNQNYAGATLSMKRVAYTAPATAPTELVGVLISGAFDATGNYWGVTVPTSGAQVVEMTSGAVNFTQFKTTTIAGTGPQQ